VKGFGHLRGVATLELDREACVGCGGCAEVCPHQVFVLREIGRASCRERVS
jgi:formate hydrogenlyase subunit 6/NADH:ubiquinone oxidoreductase subunit I